MTREAVFSSEKPHVFVSSQLLYAWSQLLALAIARRCLPQREDFLDVSCSKRCDLRLGIKVYPAKVLLGVDCRCYLSVLKVVFILEESRAREIVAYG